MKRILVIAEEEILRKSRVAILRTEGYIVESVTSSDAGMSLLESESFDLILIGRDRIGVLKQIDQCLRERHPNLKTLKIQLSGDMSSIYPTRTVGSAPGQVLAAAADMLQGHPKVIPDH